MKPKLTPDAEARLIKAIDDGMERGTVAERFGLSRTQINRILIRVRRDGERKTP